MKRKLILHNAIYPRRFEEIDVAPQTGVSKITCVEQMIMKKINMYNIKLNVENILYVNIKEEFEDIIISNDCMGVIIEEHSISENEIDYYRDKGCYICGIDSNYYSRKIIEYIWVSPSDEATRNAFISQTIFPTIIDNMENSLVSPSYAPMKHKMMFLNILNTQITSKMILKHIALIYSIGIDYVEIFEESLNIMDIPLKLSDFLEMFDPGYSSNYSVSSNTYENDYYKIEFNKKEITLKQSKLVNSIIEKSLGQYDFNGSSEKFYWMEVYPTSIIAYNLGYKIDYSEYKNFCETYKTRFSVSSSKFKRCITLLNYLKKYIKNEV